MSDRVTGTEGEPDLRVAGLKVWVHGRRNDKATEFWDANWLSVTALCAEGGSSVRIHGSILHLSELEAFVKECAELHRTLNGTATLACAEPNLGLVLSPSNRSGGICAEVSLTPDPVRQQHIFRFDIDQSHLPEAVRQMRDILERVPVRGERG